MILVITALVWFALGYFVGKCRRPVEKPVDVFQVWMNGWSSGYKCAVNMDVIPPSEPARSSFTVKLSEN